MAIKPNDDLALGSKAFSEACTHFKLFTKTIPVPTRRCKNLITGEPDSQMNYAYDLEVDDLDALSEDLALLKKTRVPMTLICDTKRAASLHDYFARHEVILAATAQAKIRELSNFDYVPNPSVILREVNTPDMLHIWRDIAAIGFEYSRQCDGPFFDHYLTTGKHREKVKLFLAYIEGVAAGQCMLILGDTVVSHMWDSVLPEYRNRGILTEMIYYRNAITKQLGYTSSVVQCMPTSDSAYSKTGYQNMEKLNIYTMMPL